MEPSSRWEPGLHKSSKDTEQKVTVQCPLLTPASMECSLNFEVKETLPPFSCLCLGILSQGQHMRSSERNACLGWRAVTDKGVLGGRRKCLLWITKEILIALVRDWQWGIEEGVSDSITFIKGLLEHWFSTFLILPLFSTVHVVTYNRKIISGAAL